LHNFHPFHFHQFVFQMEPMQASMEQVISLDVADRNPALQEPARRRQGRRHAIVLDPSRLQSVLHELEHDDHQPEVVLRAVQQLLFTEELKGQLNQASVCVVCLEDFKCGDGLSRLPGCQHLMHEVCIAPWLQCASTCPICRKDLVQAACRGEQELMVPATADGGVSLADTVGLAATSPPQRLEEDSPVVLTSWRRATTSVSEMQVTPISPIRRRTYPPCGGAQWSEAEQQLLMVSMTPSSFLSTDDV